MPDEVTRSLGDQRPTGSLTRPADTGLPDLILGMPILSKTHMYIAYGERKVYITTASDAALAQPASASRPAETLLNVSGSWKIASSGVVPVCAIVQTDTELKGFLFRRSGEGGVNGNRDRTGDPLAMEAGRERQRCNEFVELLRDYVCG